MSKKIHIKTPIQIAAIREAGKILNELLILTAKSAKVGISLEALEKQADSFLKSKGVRWSFKGYNWFPANLCLSVNDCVVHGIPDETVLKNWDLLKIDAGVTYEWYIADAAISMIVWGNTKNPQWAKLITTTKASLDAWLAMIYPWTSCMGFAKTVQKMMLSGWCSIIKNLTGHGVGIDVHEAPHIYNRPHPSMEQIKWIPGRVVALEPITAEKSSDFKEKKWNKRNLYTTKGDFWGQREYTIAITESGYELLAGITDIAVLG